MSKSKSSKRKNPALGLAARIRSAVSRRSDDARQRQELLARRAARIEVELPLLFEHLQEMGDATGVLQVDRGKDWIQLAFGNREIRIESRPEPERPDRLDIRATGIEQGLSGHFSEEADSWALRIDYAADKSRGLPERSRTLALLGAGLEWLVVQGLDLPLGDPEPDDDPSTEHEL